LLDLALAPFIDLLHRVSTEREIDQDGGFELGTTGCHRLNESPKCLRSDNLVDHLPIIWFGIGAVSRKIVQSFSSVIIFKNQHNSLRLSGWSMAAKPTVV
jgi:hypothetical protein